MKDKDLKQYDLRDIRDITQKVAEYECTADILYVLLDIASEIAVSYPKGAFEGYHIGIEMFNDRFRVNFELKEDL
jgi:hypothetical protein